MRNLLLKAITNIQLKLIMPSLSEALLMDAKGNFIKPFNLDSKIDLETVALSLSRTKRFFGQTELSVAQHCVNMAKIFLYQGKREESKQSLAHEISEGFCGDLVTPIKQNMPLFSSIEDILLEKAFKFYNIKYPISKDVKKLDKMIVINEALEHMPNKKYWLSIGTPVNEDLLTKAGVELKAWSSEKAYNEFMKYARELDLI